MNLLVSLLSRCAWWQTDGILTYERSIILKIIARACAGRSAHANSYIYVQIITTRSDWNARLEHLP